MMIDDGQTLAARLAPSLICCRKRGRATQMTKRLSATPSRLLGNKLIIPYQKEPPAGTIVVPKSMTG